ncbi:hypothetical protein LCGC14_2563320 [marine sediment metagenome]|uniref:Uncharacterized protein n=1 Tax=marine sediment metagenome TaxID=412755 RepID=A0A0F9CVN8_9ZZZZ
MTVPDFGDIGGPLWEAFGDLEDDFMELADDIRGKLIDWSAAVARGDLSLDDLRNLLEGEKALLELTALQKKVETKVLLNALKGNLIDTLIEAVKRAL